MKARLPYLIAILLLAGMVGNASAQVEPPKVIQLSGIVLGNDSTTALPGVHVYVPLFGRGTTTNGYGYFSMPVLVGDSLVISAVGYEKQSYIVPGDQGESITEVFHLVEDTLFLDNIDVMPFPTEEAFKEAVLALRLPDENKQLKEALDGEFLAYMMMNTPYDGSLNARWFFEQQLYYQNNRYGNVANPFLNPFNWARFIESLRNGDFKKKKKTQ